jgi:hypothetical protein
MANGSRRPPIGSSPTSSAAILARPAAAPSRRAAGARSCLEQALELRRQRRVVRAQRGQTPRALLGIEVAQRIEVLHQALVTIRLPHASDGTSKLRLLVYQLALHPRARVATLFHQAGGDLQHARGLFDGEPAERICRMAVAATAMKWSRSLNWRGSSRCSRRKASCTSAVGCRVCRLSRPRK